MPAGFNQHSSDIESVVGVQFSILSPEEIERSSVVEITAHNPYEGNEPKIGGLFDPRMGVLDNGKMCRTCGQTNHNCPGHFGHYRLTRPVYYIQFHAMIMNVLKCICISCSKLRIDKDLHTELLNRKGEVRWKEVLALSSNIKRCGQECEDGCGAPLPDKFTREGIARIVAHYQIGDGDKKQTMQKPLEVEYVHRLFRRITDEDVDFMGLSRYWCRPDWMICTILRIPPPQVRPSVVQDNNQRSEDDLTHKLFDIIKNDMTLRDKIKGGSSKHVIDEMTNVVQYHVATLVDNDIPGVAPSAQRSGRPLKSIQQRLGGKEGRIRYNIQGKRVEFSARSVITPDPNLSVAEIGVPLEIAMNLTRPESVTPYNLDLLYKLVQNGADKWPGAKTIVRKDGRMISLKHVKTEEIVLYNGDVVNRHLMDNDILLFNRQPTLHKMSMMGHRVKVLPYKTFRMNVLTTRPYNADFDGDEMNAHIPQSYEATVELEEIAAVPHHIITPRHAKPMIGVYQDTLVGSYRLTQDGIQFTRREFMNLMMWNKRFDGAMPVARSQEDGRMRWTGQQVLGALMPPINLEMGNKSFDKDKGDTTESSNYVKIVQGDIQQGVIDGDIYMKPSKGIIHVAYNDCGSKDTVDLLDSLQNTVENFLVLNGFSVGISDLIADENTKKEIDQKIQEKKKQVEQVILQVHLDLFDNNTGKTNQQEFEDQIFGILNQATSDAGSTGQKSLSSENRLLAMVRSGSKGEPLNVAQMMACLGQTAIEGKRVPYGFTDRTLPHYKKYDDSSEARGFIESSFIRGLTPQQFFFHAMSGREGLIDTAVKTADTGYIQRQLIKSMEDLTVQHDGTVRDANNNIIQFHYGEDGINPTKIETQTLSIGKMSKEDIESQFGMRTVDWATVLKDGVVRNDGEQVAEYVEELLYDQRMMVEGVFQKKSLDSGSVFAPVNLARWVLNMKNRFALKATEKTDLTPGMVLAGIKKIIERTHSYHKIWAALLRFHLAPHKLIVQERFTKNAFEVLMEIIVVTHMKSWVQPGDQVGIVAAQSIGEPATQMTLNTFHQAGVASKSAVTRGVPRLRELLKVTQNPKATSLTIYLKPEYRDNKDKAREVVQDLELTVLRSITEKVAIYWDEKDSTTIVEEDKELMKFYSMFEDVLMADEGMSEPWSKWMLRLELNREEMFNRNISIQEVVSVIKIQFNHEISVVYSDYNSDKLVMRVRLPNKSTGDKDTASQLDDFTNLKKFQNKLLNSIVIRGMPGIKAVTFRKDKQYVEVVNGKYEPVEQYVLDTDGSNFIKVMNHPTVDGTKLYSTNVWDIYEVLGIEATRAVLFNEINGLFESVGVNYRHLCLLCDVMTRFGKLMSIDRYGINKNDIGTLAKASFEETEKILLKAALFGEVDPVTGVSANIMMGQAIRGGTAFSQILLDDQMLPKLLADVDVEKHRLEEEEEGDLDRFDETGMQLTDPCSSTQFQMSMILPSAKNSMEEPEIELEELVERQ
uniref:DNA-directed RNA polymerase n=1 Tax=viral metagenome TaxID=1070528 RepID=A0A6C0KU07_9ZZZZ